MQGRLILVKTGIRITGNKSDPFKDQEQIIDSNTKLASQYLLHRPMDMYYPEYQSSPHLA